MKYLATSLLVGSAYAAAAAPQQHVLKPHQDQFASVPKEVPQPAAKAWDSFKQLGEALEHASDEVQSLWDEMKMLFPESMDDLQMLSWPKSHTRRPDSQWDHVLDGSDIQAMWVENAQGQKERVIDGQLEQYSLRTKKVDPSKLNVDKVKQYSGYIDEKEKDKHFFYWFFESRNDPKNDPVVLWLNGGPGCSSLTGLFMELGPSWVNEKGGLDYNDYSWNANASVIFLDQPVNTGYSYSGDAVSDSTVAAKDVYAFLTLFFKQFPEYAKQDFHITGESYAGHYIPAMASEILSHKKRNINLQSVAIGNGLTDGLTQYAYYKPMACGDGGWPAVVSEEDCEAMDSSLGRCESLIQSCYDSESVWTCVPAAIYCNNALIGPYQRTGQNVYDVREPCGSGGLCYDQVDWIAEYLNKPEVMKAVGAEVSTYEGCNSGINRDFLFHGDWMKPYHHLVPKILEEIPVMIYAGDADFICNWLGNKAWTEELEWKGGREYKKEKMHAFKLSDDGKKVGEFKTHGNLTFTRIYAAGHMVPYNQPEASLDMLNRWISGKGF